MVVGGTLRTILIVGGGSGIGRACVDIAQQDYDHVTVVDVGPADTAAPAQADGAELHYVEADVTVPGAMAAVVADVLDRTGRIDALVNTVGGATPRPFLELSVPEWDAELAFNLRSVFLTCQAVAAAMVPARQGAIVLASSGYGSRPGPGRVAYAAAKAGILGLSRSLAAELGPHGIRVNVMSPGPTDTARFRAMLTEDEVEAVRSLSVLGRLSDPSDCAEAAMFLVSEAARQITGQILHVNGGIYMSSA